jgi:FixJ family two-component response regulator
MVVASVSETSILIGAVDCLVKPFSETALNDALQRSVAQP